MSISRDQFASFLPRTRTVSLAEFGGHVVVRELRAAEVVEYSGRQKTDPMSAVHYAVRVATLDDDRANIFTPEDETNVIPNLPYKAMDAVVDAVLDLTGLKADEKKGAGGN